MTRWKKIALYGLGLGLLGFGVMASGVIPIYASVDHPGPMATVMSFAKRRSFATYSLGVEVPTGLDDPGRIRLGAAHYEQGCRFCHGTPWDAPPWAREALSPPPPALDDVAERYDAAELYLMVNHGIALTAMPAWPSRIRDDEPWAVVAFLQALPELDARDYGAWTDRPERSEEVPEVVRRRCAMCHGLDGRQHPSTVPILAGQRRAVLAAALRAYAEGERHSGLMAIPAADLDDEAIDTVAGYYAGLPGLATPAAPARDDGDEGALVAFEGVPDEHIPACASCHGPAEHEHAETYPILAGQSARYLERQLRLFASDTRGGSPAAELMEPVASHRLSDTKRRAVAAFYARLGR